MSEEVKIDSKTIHEVLPDLPARRIHSTCKMCNKKMQAWGEVTTIMWNDYFDGSGGEVDLCESCAKIIIEKIKEIIGET